MTISGSSGSALRRTRGSLSISTRPCRHFEESVARCRSAPVHVEITASKRLKRWTGYAFTPVIGFAPDGVYVRADHPWAEQALAALYDAFSFEDDLPLYLELAQAQGQHVLEVACGTGRLVVPLVKDGFQVVGIDASEHMLSLAQTKLDGTAGPGRAELVKADMRSFQLARHDFDLAIIAVKSFAYLLEREDQLRCLEAIYAHLRPGALLAIDLLHPRPEFVNAPIGMLRDDLVQRGHGDGRLTVQRVESVVSADLARQTRVIRSTYEVVDTRGAVVEKRFVEWPYRWTYRFEAEHLLERAGFAIEALYGGYRRERFTSDSGTMLFLARKP